MLKSLSPIDVALIKKIGGNGSSYTLPIATETTLGGVKPVTKTDTMTQAVGVDEAGALWTAEGGGGGGKTWELIADITIEELVNGITITKDMNGSPISLSEIFIIGNAKQERADGVGFTGNKNVQITINGGTQGYSGNNLGSGDAFVTFYAHYKVLCGVLMGFLERPLVKPSGGGTHQEIHTYNEQYLDSISQIMVNSQYVFSGGVQNRFSVGSTFKIYGVRA